MVKRLLITPQNPNGILEDVLENELLTQQQKFDASMSTLRAKRNVLLSDTDFYANSDVTMSDTMRTYRQALRDITNGLTTVAQVEAVEFPEKP
jgi:hypothetical protein